MNSRAELRVPYLKGGFEIEGLPSGIDYKKADGTIKHISDYGSKQINKIMEVKDDIKFQILTASTTPSDSDQNTIARTLSCPDEVQEPDVTTEESPEINETSHTSEEPDVPACLLKIVDGRIAISAMKGSLKIREEDVEVTNIRLRDSEYQELMSKYDYLFDDDALQALTRNYETSAKEVSLIFPVYTAANEKEPYWLFLYNGDISDMVNSSAETKLPGFWLERSTGNKFSVLSGHPEHIFVKNVIKSHSTGNFLYTTLPKEYCEGELVQVSPAFHSDVMDSLHKHGFVKGKGTKSKKRPSSSGQNKISKKKKRETSSSSDTSMLKTEFERKYLKGIKRLFKPGKQVNESDWVIKSHYIDFIPFRPGLAQSTIDGRNGSSACLAIALMVAVQFSNPNFSHLLDKGAWGKDLKKHFIASIRAGNEKFEKSGLTTLPTVAEAIVALQVPFVKESYTGCFYADELIGYVDDNRNNGVTHFALVVHPNKGMLFKVNSEGEYYLFDSHAHGDLGAFIVHAEPDKAMYFWKFLAGMAAYYWDCSDFTVSVSKLRETI